MAEVEILCPFDEETQRKVLQCMMLTIRIHLMLGGLTRLVIQLHLDKETKVNEGLMKFLMMRVEDNEVDTDLEKIR